MSKRNTEVDRFQQDVIELTRSIPYGRVTSYGAIARSIGSKGASRRVGWVLNASLSAIPIVPAHRVVNRIGQLTGRMHFPENNSMESQLEAEGIQVKENVVVDFKVLFWDPQVEWLN